jgi:hypothetical protein
MGLVQTACQPLKAELPNASEPLRAGKQRTRERSAVKHVAVWGHVRSAGGVP